MLSQLQEIMVNIIEAARERGAVGESGGWLGGASQLMSSLLNSVQSSDPPMPMGMDNFFKELYRLCQFVNIRTLHLQTLLRRDDDTMVAETFYKRQSVPSFVQTLSRKTMRTRPQHQYSLIRSSLSLSGARQEWDNAVGVRGARVGQPYPLAIDLSGG